MSSKVSALHPIEKKILHLLAKEGPLKVEVLSEKCGLTVDQVRRGVERLKFKQLIAITQNSSNFFELDDRGKSALLKGLPERRLVSAIQLEPDNGIAMLAKTQAFERDELGVAIRIARDQNHWLIPAAGDTNRANLRISQSVSQTSSEEQVIELFRNVERIPENELTDLEKKGVELLIRRPKYIKKIQQQTVTVSLTAIGRSTTAEIAVVKFPKKEFVESETRYEDRPENFVIDLEAAVKVAFPGKTHPLTDLIAEIKEIFVSLGFTEIEGDIIQTSFWNFDALFTLQDHPAREMHDTYYLSGLGNVKQIASKEQIANVSKIHNKNSLNVWDIQESNRLVLRTHTTPVTLKYLADSQPDEAKLFSVGSVFRNEKITKGHLSEFFQIEGVVTKPDASVRDLMGLQTEFYRKLGIQKVRFWPTFFPYTEPSLQSMVYIEKADKWLELFGMGIFRDEVTRPMKIRNPVLAWGGGLERLAMLRLGLDDIRTLYSNKIEWLRSVPKCQL
ncbi:MAG TPA: phenylalanine--tRNA ligase subunit alpha [Nitrososphaeraceae archaeon]|nr:phenylalanine--tRNA ligase subunit alpha [Nitrososphaeraceae archaeon]